jgi:protein-disulfide isomerase
VKTVVAAGLGAALSGRRARAQWFALRGDDGKPLENLRLPVELRAQVEHLRGVMWLGSNPDVVVTEFFDYNCPYCRAAVADIDALLKANPGLQVVLVNNPIISPMSAQAAKAGLAVLALRGQQTAYQFYRDLFARRGSKDGTAAIAAAERLGISRARLTELADGGIVQAALAEQMRLAAALMLAATPSFIIGTAGILGYPGPRSLAGMIESVERCGEVAC